MSRGPCTARRVFWRETRGGLELSLAHVKTWLNELISAQIERPPHHEAQVEALATEFSRVLQRWFREEWVIRRHGVNILKRVQELNREDPDPRVCHTHDFVDANEAMLVAWETVMGRPFFDPTGAGVEPYEGYALWNAAWTVAKQQGFQRVRVATTLWSLNLWLDRPTYGQDPVSGKELRPRPEDLQSILVALDAMMET